MASTGTDSGAPDKPVRDLSLAILTQRKKPNQLIVEENPTADSSTIILSDYVLNKLQLFRGDTVTVRGKLRRDTVLVVLSSDEVDVGTARINSVVRKNLKVNLGDVITVHPCPDIKYAKRIAVLPIADTVEDLSGSLFHDHLAPYFRDAYRPVRQGDLFVTRNGATKVEFKVVEVDPPIYGVVGQDCVIHCEGEPLSRANEAPDSAPGYGDIGGYQTQLAKVMEKIALPLTHPELYQALGVVAAPRIILHGPPGTGKSRMARAVASETGSFFFLLNGPVYATYIQKAVAEAKKNAPSIIAIDNIDLIAPRRQNIRTDAERETLLQLLSTLEELEETPQVAVIGMTSQLSRVDTGLRQPGLFDTEVEFGLPTTAERIEILRVHMRNMQLAKDIKIDQIADAARGYTGADLVRLCREAGLQRIRHWRDVDLIDLDPGSDEIDRNLLSTMEVRTDDFLSVITPRTGPESAA